MNKLVFRLLAFGVLAIAAPASAQESIGANSGGAGVQLGPVGVGFGPQFSDDRYYRSGYNANAYDGDCRLNPFACHYARRSCGVQNATGLRITGL